MSAKILWCVSIVAVTLAFPILELATVRKRKLRKFINKLGVIWTVSIIAVYFQQIVF